MADTKPPASLQHLSSIDAALRLADGETVRLHLESHDGDLFAVEGVVDDKKRTITTPVTKQVYDLRDYAIVRFF